MDARGEEKGRPRVRILALGGTIAMANLAPDGVGVSLDAGDLVARSPGLGDIAVLDARSLAAVGSSQLDLVTVDMVRDEIEEARAQGLDGVVVTQGTDTMEEVAFALDCLVDTTTMAVVVTGAMRNPTVAGHDGPANLAAAVRVAVSTAARGLGVVVVMNDEIHAAALVTKGHTSGPGAFASSPGALGWVVEDRVTVLLTPRRHERVGPGVSSGAHRVGLVRTFLGDHGEIAALTGDILDGLVVEAFGSGRVSPAMARVLIDLSSRMTVVIASRTGAGENTRSTYRGEGSESHLLAHGLVSAGWLTGVKSRMLLELLLRAGASHEEIASAFARHAGTTA